MAKKFKIVAHLPSAVELTKRTTKNALRIDVKIDDSKEGTLYMSRGTVEWWPDHNSVHAHRGDWEKIAELLETLPQKRSKRKRKKK